MDKQGARTDVIVSVTEVAMGRVSRRGFMGVLGVAGLAVLTADTGLKAPAAYSAGDYPCCPDGPPKPCTGTCSACFSSCITGGNPCSFQCQPWIDYGNFCSPHCAQARGYYDSCCRFYCTVQPCTGC